MQAQTLLLIRSNALTVKEATALPRSFQAVLGSHPIVARADVSLSAKEIVAMAVQAGRILLDAEVVFHERTAPMSGSLMPLDQYVYTLGHTNQAGGVSLTSTSMDINPIQDAVIVEDTHTPTTSQTGLAAPQRSIFERMNDTVLEDEAEPPRMVHWWDYVEAGQTDVALSMIAQEPRLTHDAQMKARELMQSDDPEKVVFICFAARQFEWKSWVLSLRKLFAHVDPRVRAAAVSAVGELAGPSLAPSVYPMLSDVDPEVRRAAEAAHRKLDR
jgi:hypothetical protein